MNLRRLGTRPLLALVLLSAIGTSAAAPASVHLDRSGEKWAASTLRKMTLEEKIGQMIMVWAHVQFLNVDSPEYLLMQEEMRTYHVGGFGVTIAGEGGMLVKSQPLEAAQLTNELQKDSKYPLFFAADFERGLPLALQLVAAGAPVEDARPQPVAVDGALVQETERGGEQRD